MKPWSRKKSGPSPNVASPIWLSAVLCSAPAGKPDQSAGALGHVDVGGERQRRDAREHRRREQRPSSSSVVAALRPFGCSNAGTPFETASTPVSAVQPDAKARRTRNTVSSPPVSAAWRSW